MIGAIAGSNAGVAMMYQKLYIINYILKNFIIYDIINKFYKRRVYGFISNMAFSCYSIYYS